MSLHPGAIQAELMQKDFVEEISKVTIINTFLQSFNGQHTTKNVSLGSAMQQAGMDSQSYNLSRLHLCLRKLHCSGSQLNFEMLHNSITSYAAMKYLNGAKQIVQLSSENGARVKQQHFPLSSSQIQFLHLTNSCQKPYDCCKTAAPNANFIIKKPQFPFT